MLSKVQLEVELRKMCKHFNITQVPEISIVDDLKGKVGCYDFINNRIVIKKISNQGMLAVFYHEFRHLWQKQVYPRLFSMITRLPTYYTQHYNNVSLEIDADEFAGCCLRYPRYWESLSGVAARSDMLDKTESYLLGCILSIVEDDQYQDIS